MDGAAVVALLVVLAQDLPVRLDDVVVATGRAQASRRIRGHAVLEPGQVVGQRAGGARGVDEDQPVPFTGGKFDEAVIAGRETIESGETGGPSEAPVEVIRPRVVGADDDGGTPGPVRWEQFVAAVPAGVGEAVHHAVVTTDQEHPGPSRRAGPLVTGLGHVLAAAHAHPPAAQEVALLPGEDVVVDVRLAGEHPALTERSERGLERLQIDRGHVVAREGLTVRSRYRVHRPPSPHCRAGADG